MTPTLKPVEPKSSRWEPTPDPNDIVIPGLDITAPVNDQIEQIEQLITIKLQNIDANFSKIQQVLASRILPALKRYSVATEPVREAAKFWVTFFEQAAQIRVPTYDDFPKHQEEQSDAEPERDHKDGVTTDVDSHHGSLPSQTFSQDGTSSEVSFMPGQAAISSTPATTSRQRVHNFIGDNDETPSWTASLESPLVRLDREIQSLTEDDAVSEISSSLAHLSLRDDSEDVTQRPIQPMPPPSSKGKGKERPEPLRHNVLKRNTIPSEPSTTASNQSVSPLKFKPKTPLIKTLNPYLPADSKPSDWGGIVDLKSPTPSTPSRSQSVSLPKFRSGFQSSAKPPNTFKRTTDDSFDEGLEMSPPITMAFARLPTLGQTPRKAAAERIMKDLLDVERRGAFGGTRAPPNVDTGTKPSTESTLSSLLSPPSLTKYTHQAPEPSSSLADASLESLMRRVGGSFNNYGVPAAESRTSIASSSHSHHSHPSKPVAEALGPSRSPPASISAQLHVPSSTPPLDETYQRIDPPQQPQFNVFRLRDDELHPPTHLDEGDISSDSLDDEELHNTGNPSAAFILASQRASYDDSDSDSFGSNQSLDSLNEDDVDPDAPVHPFARAMAAGGDDGDGFEDDSFDDPSFGGGEVEEETLFGVPPAQRLQAQAIASGGDLRMLGQSLLEDTMGIGAQMARAGRVEESPTPWGGRHGS